MTAATETKLRPNHPLTDIAGKVTAGERISKSDALRLYESDDLEVVGSLGEFARRRKAGPGKEKHVYYIQNMQLNPTNYCDSTCRFCSYANPSERAKAYTWSVDRVLEEVAKGDSVGICEVHMVGGLNPSCDIAYYEEILRRAKKQYPHIHMKALTAVEIYYLANLEHISFEETLKRLKAAGLDSMPGGGAEIFDEGVRRQMAVNKAPAEDWLEIHGIAHRLGMRTNATMLTGIGESREHKVDHMLMLRAQQDESKGFQCFIPLKCHYEFTDIAEEVTEPSDDELLRDVAISRILLDNFAHIQAYWIQLGVDLAQRALSYGADDINGTILEEKITHAAGAKTPLQLGKERIEELILSAGYTPVERDTLYNIKNVVLKSCAAK